METTRYRRADAISFTVLDEEIVCLNLESGQYVGMRDVGRTIWEQLGEPRALAELVRHVADEYDVERDTATADISGFLSNLVESGLVETV